MLCKHFDAALHRGPRGDGIDGRTDIYSLGIIFYEMLTGTRPYEGKSMTAVLMKHVQAPIPDLLSTATALHALDGLQVDFAALRDPCLDYLDSLWTGTSFCGSWADDALDSEYTFYALLALVVVLELWSGALRRRLVIR